MSSSSGVVKTVNQDDTINDASEIEDVDNRKSKTRGNGKDYEPFCTFLSLESAKKELQIPFTSYGVTALWRYIKKSCNIQHEVHWYKCHIKNCPIRLKMILNPDEKESVTIEIMNGDHAHDPEVVKFTNKSIDPKSREKIAELDRLGIKSSKIVTELRKLGLQVPTSMPNILKTIREQKGPSSFTLNTLKNWCEQRSTIPQNEDEMFVAGFDYIADYSSPKFRLFITTKRLIAFTKQVIN